MKRLKKREGSNGSRRQVGTKPVRAESGMEARTPAIDWGHRTGAIEQQHKVTPRIKS
jgi:hypothetical protein